MLGWASSALRLLTSADAPLEDGPLTNDQVGWVGSVNGLVAILGSFIWGIFVTLIGCKKALLLVALPSMIFWILIFFGDAFYYIVIARTCTGLTAGCVQVTIILFISDIANNDVRGRLGSFAQLGRNVGILIAYILGAFLQYKTIPCILVFVPIIFVISFSLLPNTPQYYLRKGENEVKMNDLVCHK